VRYYDLALYPKGSTTPFRQWSSYPNGQYDAGALNIMFDMPISAYDSPEGASTVTVEGISLQDLNQSQQFAGMTLVMKGGMKAGFPLVNPAQAGTIIVGQVLQSFGNWEGTEMTLDFVIYPSTYTNDNPGNIVLNWRAGQELSVALQDCLSIAYPTFNISMNVKSGMVNSHDIPAHYSTLEQLATFVTSYTDETFGNPVYITIQQGKLLVIDIDYSPGPVQLAFTDFVGQPTWIDAQVIQIKCVMRADLQIGSIITMPKGLQNAPGVITSTAQSLPSSIKYQSTFQNNFTVNSLRQVGNFRSSDSSQWVTVLNCVQNANA
jgi:hypothetical protein